MDKGSSISDFFSDLTEPRDSNKRHKLIDIITIALCAVICGADTWEDIEEFGDTKKGWFERFLELPHGIPGHDTFARVFASMNPKEFQQAFLRWVEAVQTVTKRIVAIDGKTLRRSHEKNKSPLHLVSAWALENKMVLGQVKTREKSNEITAIPELLSVLELGGCIVTIDAMGCQKEIVKTIIGKGADYVLGLKGNQGTLHDDVGSRTLNTITTKPSMATMGGLRQDGTGSPPISTGCRTGHSGKTSHPSSWCRENGM
jgi:predicted transposase YbfD/YdcC